MGDMDKSEKFTAAGYLFIPIGMFTSRPPHPSGVRPPSRRARAPQGRTGEPGMVTPWGTREGALWHVAHIDRY